MMKRFLWAFSLIFTLLMLAGCERDHLYFGNKDMAVVRLDINWDSCHLSPNGASVLAYNADDGTLYRHFPPFSDPKTAFIMLPVGRYNLVVFNNTPAEFEGMIGFRNEEQWSSYEAYTVVDPGSSPVSRPKREQADDRIGAIGSGSDADNEEYELALEPDTLAAAQVFDLVVTPEMITYYWDVPGTASSHMNDTIVTTLQVTPQRVVSVADVRVHVKGLCYAKGKVQAYLRGLSEGYFLGKNQFSDTPVAHEFWLNNRVYDEGSNTDGTISASFCTFGMRPNGDHRYYLDLLFTLVNGEAYPLTFDVSDMIVPDVNLQMQLQLHLDLDVPLPDVVGGDEGGGFQTNLSQWEDIVQDIEL